MSKPKITLAEYWKFYQQLGSLRPHSLATLCHIMQLYHPQHNKPTEPQRNLFDRALAELQRRVEQSGPIQLPNPLR